MWEGDNGRLRSGGHGVGDPRAGSAGPSAYASTYRVRPARLADLEQILALSMEAGAGLTSLPADRQALRDRLGAHEAAMAGLSEPGGSDPVVLVLEDPARDVIAGTGNLTPRIGRRAPFLCYRLETVSRASIVGDMVIESEILRLTDELSGASEVGGLFLSESVRGAGLGRLLARSRYLFVATHREGFSDKVVAELRGVQVGEGCSPFWEAVGSNFFPMSFADADHCAGIHGGRFIASLLIDIPIHLGMLPDAARRAVGEPHQAGRPALGLLLEEGFRRHGHVHVLDAGPTVVADTCDIRAVREARNGRVRAIAPDLPCPRPCLIAAGAGWSFRVAKGEASVSDDGDVIITPALADLLETSIGGSVRHAPF